MARREWAHVKGQKTPKRLGETDIEFCARVAKAEHARAVRIVKRAKRLEFHGLRDTDTNEFLEGYEAACVDILSAITKGRV